MTTVIRVRHCPPLMVNPLVPAMVSVRRQGDFVLCQVRCGGLLYVSEAILWHTFEGDPWYAEVLVWTEIPVFTIPIAAPDLAGGTSPRLAGQLMAHFVIRACEGI